MMKVNDSFHAVVELGQGYSGEFGMQSNQIPTMSRAASSHAAAEINGANTKTIMPVAIRIGAKRRRGYQYRSIGFSMPQLRLGA